MADIESAIALTDSDALAKLFTSKFPNYKIIPRGKKVVVVGTGAAKGVGVIIRGPNKFRMNWQFPSIAVQLIQARATRERRLSQSLWPLPSD